MGKSNMYEDSAGSINFHVGCRFGCTYCVPSFQRQMKRQKKRCPDCGRYTPHAHLERLEKGPPKTTGDQFIFFPSASDWRWIPTPVGDVALAYVKKWSNRRFLMQSKDPITFRRWPAAVFQFNAIFGVTLETNRDNTVHFSTAPRPIQRAMAMESLRDSYGHVSRFVTIEPVMEFDSAAFEQMILGIEPECVYIGYNSRPKEVQLPEPSLEKVMSLIEYLRECGLDVREKLLREPWVSGR